MSRMNEGNQPQGKTGSGAEAASKATEQMRQTATEVAGKVRDLGTQARDAAVEQYGQIRDTATDYYEQGRDKAREWTGQLEQYVHEEPIKALLIAAAAGLVFGAIWRRM